MKILRRLKRSAEDLMLAERQVATSASIEVLEARDFVEWLVGYGEWDDEFTDGATRGSTNGRGFKTAGGVRHLERNSGGSPIPTANKSFAALSGATSSP